MNDLDLCLEVVLRSCQPLRHIRHWIPVSRKPLQIEAIGSKGPPIERHMGYQMVTCLMTSRDTERSNSWPQYA